MNSSALGAASAKKDKLSNLALPHFTHMQNGEWNINFSGACKALIQTGEKKSMAELKKGVKHPDIIYDDKRDTFHILCFISLYIIWQIHLNHDLYLECSHKNV